MIEQVLERLSSRMSFTTGRRLMWMAGALPGVGWKSTIDKYRDHSDDDLAGKLEDLLVQHALYSEKHVKLHPMQQSLRTALQDKLVSLQLPESPQRNAYPLPLAESELATADGKFVPVSVEVTPDGVGLVISQIVVQKTREVVEKSDEFSNLDFLAQYDELVGIKLTPVPLFHVMWVPHERDFVEFRLDCTLGTGARNAFAVHSLLRRFCTDYLDVQFEEAYDLFEAITSLYGNDQVGRATEISFSTPTNGLHNERMLRKEEGDSRTQAYHLAGKKGVDEDISVFHITVEWQAMLSERKTYPISVSLRGSGPSGNGPGGNPVVRAVMLEGCLTSADFEHLIEVLVRHARIEPPPMIQS